MVDCFLVFRSLPFVSLVVHRDFRRPIVFSVGLHPLIVAYLWGPGAVTGFFAASRGCALPVGERRKIFRHKLEIDDKICY